MHNIGWNDRNAEFAPKLERLTRKIDLLAKGGNAVSLIGASAGGSAALNAFIEQKKVVDKVISISGILRPSKETGFRSFEKRTRSSKPFAQSVKLFVKKEHALSKIDRKRIMTIYPKFGDELVAPDTATLPGAINIQISSFEHILSIVLTLTLFSKPIMRFLIT